MNQRYHPTAAPIIRVMNGALIFLPPNQVISIASSGHTSIHRPHLTQFPPLLSIFSTSSGVMAYIVHSRTHSIHEVHFAGSIVTRKALILGMRDNPAPTGHMTSHHHLRLVMNGSTTAKSIIIPIIVQKTGTDFSQSAGLIMLTMENGTTKDSIRQPTRSPYLTQ